MLHPLRKMALAISAAMRTGRVSIALDEARIHPLGLADHLDLVEALEDLFPDDLQLQLGEPHADAAVDAEAERQMRARPRAVDDEVVGTLDRLLVAVARDVPHHDLVALLDLSCRGTRSPASAVRRICASGVCQRITSGTKLSSSAGFSRSFSYWSGCWLQRIDAARHGVAGGVVAADDQQDQVAEEILRVHVARGVAVRHHRQQVALRRLVDALLPEPREIARAFQQLGLPLLLGRDQAAGAGNRGCDVGPARQLAAVLPGEVEQHRQHLRGQLDRDACRPSRTPRCAGRLSRQLGRALADVDRELVEMGRREHRRHGLALRGVARLVHGDEALAAQVRRRRRGW